MTKALPKISVVIATRSRLSSLKRCVEALCAQDYPKELLEMIIVNDGSTDSTSEYLSALSVQEPWIKAVSQARGWQASARNTGIGLSSGELVAITDDDCVVAGNWLLSFAEAMQDQDIVGVAGHVQAPGSSLIANYLEYVHLFDPPLEPSGAPRYVVTANACYRRSALDRVDFFDAAFGESTGEDTELSLRMRRKGMKLKYVPSCRVAHWFEPDITKFLRRFYRYGVGVRHIFDKHRAWECWLPGSHIIFQALLSGLANGEVKSRAFHEVEDPGIRPWYTLLALLQYLAFLAGYLGIRNVEQLLSLLPPSSWSQFLPASSAWMPVELIKVRREQAEAVLQALSIDPLPEGYQEGYRAWFDQDVFPHPEAGKEQAWVCMAFKMIGIDLLLEVASSSSAPYAEPGIPDTAISATTRAMYDFRYKRRKRAYARRYHSVLQQLTQHPGGITLASIEELCNLNSICVNSFLSWYGDIVGVDAIASVV